MKNNRVWIVLAVILALALVAELLFVSPHTNNIWDSLPGFDILFGIAGSFLLILLGKGILGPLLQKSEDFYKKEGED